MCLSGSDGSDRTDNVNGRNRHFMYGFGSDIDRELHRVYHRLLGVKIVCKSHLFLVVYNYAIIFTATTAQYS